MILLALTSQPAQQKSELCTLLEDRYDDTTDESESYGIPQFIDPLPVGGERVHPNPVKWVKEEANARLEVSRVCPVCQKGFIGLHNQVFCSRHCQRKSYQIGLQIQRPPRRQIQRKRPVQLSLI